MYGIRNGSANEKGNNRIGEPNNSVDQKSQSDLAAQMGISVDTLQNYKLLADMIPELKENVAQEKCAQEKCEKLFWTN